MGLGITAYKNIVPFNGEYHSEKDQILNLDTGETLNSDEFFTAYLAPDFPTRAPDIQDRAHYLFSKHFSFYAGTYREYNDWREQLAKLAGYPAVEKEPEKPQVQPKPSSWFNKVIDFFAPPRPSSDPVATNTPLPPSYAHSRGAWQATTGPFWELIYFTDCEGILGCEVSQKLLQDFLDYDTQAQQLSPFFYELYGYWKQAFACAAEQGVVVFH